MTTRKTKAAGAKPAASAAAPALSPVPVLAPAADAADIAATAGATASTEALEQGPASSGTEPALAPETDTVAVVGDLESAPMTMLAQSGGQIIDSLQPIEPTHGWALKAADGLQLEPFEEVTLNVVLADIGREVALISIDQAREVLFMVDHLREQLLAKIGDGIEADALIDASEVGPGDFIDLTDRPVGHVMKIRSTSANGRRRAGLSFGPEPIEVATDDLTSDQWQLLLADEDAGHLTIQVAD